MKKFLVLVTITALASFSSCQKQQTEEERKADIEREVQARLAAEHQTKQQQELDQRGADLDAREKALADKEKLESRPAQAQSPSRSTSYQASRGAEPPAAGSYSMFYTKLTPYGDWTETSDYGYVWHPYEAERARDWRPYTNGRWVYSDVGWMWVSEEPFGWAAYHYGRWIRLRGIGWVWVPGDTWAPAWVSWRKSNDYVGWAPLPPEARFEARSGIRNWADRYYDIGPEQYSFVPTRQFGTQRVAPVVVNPEQNINIINQTVNVTNITYNNTTVVNYGPDYNELQRQTQQPIERLRVERRTNVNLETETPQTVVKGDVVEVPAPVISKAQPAAAPPRVKQKIGKVMAERGWEGVHDPRAVETLRAKIKAESTPPPDAPLQTFVKPEQAPSGSAAPTPVGTMAPTTSISREATTPSPRTPQRSPSLPASATPEATAVDTPAPRPTRPARATSARTTPVMTSPPAAAESAASPVEVPQAGRRRFPPARAPKSPQVTTPSSQTEGTVAPSESPPPDKPSLPRGGRHQTGERKNQTRKSAAQQFETRQTIPGAAAEASIPPASSEPQAPAAADREQQERDIKREKKGRGRGREANESPTPTGESE